LARVGGTHNKISTDIVESVRDGEHFGRMRYLKEIQQAKLQQINVIHLHTVEFIVVLNHQTYQVTAEIWKEDGRWAGKIKPHANKQVNAFLHNRADEVFSHLAQFL
jgi:hypothetical protein